MCGLAALIDPSCTPETAGLRAQAALRALAHRGPDEQNHLRMGTAELVHARLSIVDLATSLQPMCAPDGVHTLVFNGEIYNHDELRRALASRWVFRTRGDTEVLLAGLVLFGPEFLGRLNGMWALALWNERRGELLLARDRMGEKPLYYTQRAADHFACASELPALRELAGSPWSEDIDSTADYFRYGYCLPGYTAWSGVHEVLPGHWLRWRSGEKVEQQPYWSLSDHAGATAAHSLTELLQDAIRLRMRADVEVGTFLSGGIDSSLVARLATQYTDHSLRSYTIGFDDPSYDESEHAARVARALGTEHRCERFPGWDEARIEALLHKHVGQPFADVSLLPTAQVSAVAAEEVKVVLSGDGADELFGGYQRHQGRALLRWYTRLPSPLRRLAERALSALPEPLAHHSRSVLKKAHLFVDLAQQHAREPVYTAPRLFDSCAHAALFPELSEYGHTPPGLPEHTSLDDLGAMLTRDATIYLPQDILAKVDRASMAVGLEVRAPFLDHRIVETAFAWPARAHVRPGLGKRRLRSEFHRELPAEVWKRRKQGFSAPVGCAFRDASSPLLERLHSARLPVDRSVLEDLVETHRSGRRDHGLRLWALHAYVLFHESS